MRSSSDPGVYLATTYGPDPMFCLPGEPALSPYFSRTDFSTIPTWAIVFSNSTLGWFNLIVNSFGPLVFIEATSAKFPARVDLEPFSAWIWYEYATSLIVTGFPSLNVAPERSLRS